MDIHRTIFERAAVYLKYADIKCLIIKMAAIE